MKELSRRAGIQSIEVGFPLLEVLRRSPGPLPLGKLAQEAGLTASKAHRYLVSFQRVGMVQQHASSGHYDLGQQALSLGLAAMHRLDLLGSATEIMTELTERLDESCTLAIWAGHGPTIVRHIQNARPVAVNVRVGSVMPLLTSAVGRVFLTWHSGAALDALILSELDSEPAHAANLFDWQDVERLRWQIRAAGVATIEAAMFPGVSAVAAPIFDHVGKLTAAMAIVGAQGALDVTAGTKVPAAVLDAAQRITEQAGGAKIS